MNILQSTLLVITLAVAIVGAGANANASAPLGEDIRSSVQSLAIGEHEELVSQLIIKPRTQPGSVLAASLEAKNAQALSHAALVGMSVMRPMSNNAHVVKLDQPVKLSDAKVIAARLMKYSDIELVEPDLLMRPFTGPPNDEFYSKQWHYHTPAGLERGGANLPDLWNIIKGSEHITIAVLDTGILAHADLKPEAVLQGYDFISDPAISNDGDGRDANPSDPGDAVKADECGAKSPATESSWHGTHVTGTIVATMNNSVGVTGVAPGVRVFPLRVLGKCGGYTSDVVDAMRWAAGISVTGVPTNSKPAHVLNISLGSKGLCSTTYQKAVNDVVAAGKIIIAAAGNDGATKVSQPANCTGVIAVTAHAIDGDKAHYANTGPEVVISAPGGGCGTISTALGTCTRSVNGRGVLSLFNTGTTGPGADGYAFYSGTSMAVPHVTGVVGLMLSGYPSLTPAHIRSILQSSARPHPSGTSCTSTYAGTCGAGLLDGLKAFQSITAPAVTIQPYSQVVAPNSVVTLSGSVVLSGERSVKSYTWAQVSGTSVGGINNATTDTASFTAGTTGVTSFQLTVTDSANETGKANAIVRVNSPPVLTAISKQSLVAGQSFQVTATDVDKDNTLVFHAVSLPPGASLSSSGVFDSSGMAAGTYTMTYYANDGYENSATGAVEIVVAAPASSSSGGGGSMGGSAIMWLAALVGGVRVRRMLMKAK